ncbi:hypothetical protein BKA56DRAFT_738718 [Ilyonectria sp. MPI-CAGE-AT-0026]|nr:hypothetical protein BKA56DRAFT_738718 [Ilyonectria sp. MPI-CAGE-AT-0026]
MAGLQINLYVGIGITWIAALVALIMRVFARRMTKVNCPTLLGVVFTLIKPFLSRFDLQESPRADKVPKIFLSDPYREHESDSFDPSPA